MRKKRRIVLGEGTVWSNILYVSVVDPKDHTICILKHGQIKKIWPSARLVVELLPKKKTRKRK